MKEPITDRKYQAFISYSHAADSQLAPAVQAALERFGKPWYSRSSIQVFRDQTDLALTPDLPREIQKALENSECFILLAGPDAARSIWVEKEIRFWIQHRSPNRLLVVLTGGELEWGTDDFNWIKTTALPRSLQQVFKSEPLWADLSWPKTDADRSLRNPRFLVEIAKLVAGIRGESLTDTLNRAARQHQQAMRLLWATVAALVVLTLAALGTASVSFKAKRTADKVAAAIQAQLDAAQKLLDDAAKLQRLEKEQQARETASAQLAAKAASVLAEDRELSALLALKALDIEPTREAADALRRTLLELVPPLVLQGHSDVVSGTQFSSDDKRVLTSSDDGTVCLWDAVTGTNILRLEVIAADKFGSRASGILSRDATRILTMNRRKELRDSSMYDSSVVKLYDATTGALLVEIPPQFVSDAALSPDNKQIVTAGSSAKLWDARTGKIQFDLPHEAFVDSASFSSKGAWVVTSSWWDDTVRVWEAATGRRLAVLKIPQRKEVKHVAFSPDDSRVITLCYKTGELLLWDWAKKPGEPVAIFTGHEGAVQDFAFSADGKWLATASSDRTARIWETATGKCLHILSGHEEFVAGVDFSPNGRWVVTVSGDKTAQIWDAATGENLMQLGWNNSPRTCVAFSPDGQRIITGTMDGAVPVYTCAILGSAEDLRKLARTRVHRELTPEERQKYLLESQSK